MKVLIIRTHGSVVNLNTYNSQDLGMARAMLRRGIQCDIVYFGGKQPTHIQSIETKDGIVELFWVKGISIALNGVFFGLKKIVKEYDVIQVGDYDQLTSIYLAFFSKCRERVVLYHGPYLCDYNKKYRLKCKAVDAIPLSKKRKAVLPCFTKSVLAEDFLRERGFKNIKTVGVGLDTERFDGVDDFPTPELSDILRKINGKPTLLYIGLIEPRRNTKFLIEILASVKKRVPDINMVLVGKGENEYKTEVFELAARLDVKDNIEYVESLKQTQLPFIYKESSMFLLPSSYEIFGMVLMEAMYYELPVMTTKNGGSLTLIDDQCGYIKDLNVNSWAKDICNLLTDKKKMIAMGEHGKEIVKKKCSWDRIVEEMIKNYPV